MVGYGADEYSFGCRQTLVRKNDDDFEDLDEDVYCSIAVTKHM